MEFIIDNVDVLPPEDIRTTSVIVTTMNPATWSHLSGLCALTDEIQLAIYEQNFQLYVDVKGIIPILNLKGGGNEDKNRHDIPYLTNMKFAWNGLPMIDFIEKILYPLNMGLGSFSMGKPGRTATLLLTAKRRDPGGLLGVPNIATAPADIKFEHDERVERLFCCIMNYTDSRSEFYKFAMRMLNNDGVSLYAYMGMYGNMPTPPRIVSSREDHFKRMTFDSTRCPYVPTGLNAWAEIVQAHGRVCNKTAAEMLDKFTNDLPAFFAGFAPQIKANVTCNFPATYGGIPGLAGSAINATVHPFANEPDVMRLARFYFVDWCEQLSKTNKYTPHGFVRSATERDLCDVCDDPETANMTAEKITSKHICEGCGGAGHTTTFWHNNVKWVCLTKVLSQLELPGYGKVTLSRKTDDAKSTDVISQFTDRMSEQDRHIEMMQEHIHSLEKELSYKLSIYDRKKGQKQGQKSKFSTHSRSAEPHTSRAHSMEDESSEYFEDDDDDDASSQGSIVQPEMFAEQALKDKRKFKKRY